MKATHWTTAFILTILTACQPEEDWMPNADSPAGATRLSSIEFQFTDHAATRTLTGEEALRREEGEVGNVLYAIFQNRICKRVTYDPLQGITPGELHTGTSPKQSYIVKDIPSEWLNTQTEIFAVANVSDPLREQLMQGTFVIGDEHPLLLQKVEEEIDSLARSQVYDLLIQRQYQQETVPADKKVHYLPADKSHCREKQWTLQPEYRFRTYEEFCRKKEGTSLSADIRGIYEEIAIDLQCRLPLYQSEKFNLDKTSLRKQEDNTHAIRNRWQNDRNFQRYLLWSATEYAAHLNQAAARSLSGQLAMPLMSGYYALKNDYPAEIRIPVEHVYSRIWFTFQWDGLKEAESITVDSITVEGLLHQTKLFNIEEDRMQNNPSHPQKVSHTVCHISDSTGAQPFFGHLDKGAYPYHLGAAPRMYLEQCNHRDYSTLCRYCRKDNHSIDTQRPPSRYYVYSFQWGGNTAEDDPLLTVYYHFSKTTDDSNGHRPVIYKKATARLYDENHRPGKSHHGLLRNYTYRVNGVVTTLTNTLDLQITSVSWHKITVDDIPTFE